MGKFKKQIRRLETRVYTKNKETISIFDEFELCINEFGEIWITPEDGNSDDYLIHKLDDIKDVANYKFIDSLITDWLNENY